jgi:hypothetical protein
MTWSWTALGIVGSCELLYVAVAIWLTNRRK